MPKILVINNYPLDQVWEEVKRGEKPDNHLMGINYFQENGYELEIIPLKFHKKLQKLSTFLSRMPVPLGDLDVEWSVIKKLKTADIIYAACQESTWLLSYLRAMGFIKVPIVVVAHHLFLHGRLKNLRKFFLKIAFSGTDVFPALTLQSVNEINQLSKNPDKSTLLVWGTDRHFYPNNNPVGNQILAVGRTGRDFETFGKGASLTGVDCQIICLEENVTDAFDDFAPNVKVRIESRSQYMHYKELNPIMANARALAIPVYVTQSLVGLTGIFDAIGMGKPLLMTRHPAIDIDIEKEGFGIWIPPYDVEAWKDAILWITKNEEAAIKMGQKARLLAEKYNSENSARQLMDVFERLLNSKKS